MTPQGIREQLARQDGFRLGLRTACRFLKEVRSGLVRKSKLTKPEDADIAAENQYGADILNGLMSRIEAAIRKAKR